MARPGKEQVFFFASLAITGLLGTLLSTASWSAPRMPRGKPTDPALLSRLDLAAAPRGALADRAWAREGREAFREPRDWSPLPPADLERPPLREPGYVPPPPRPSAGLGRLGLYRVPTRVIPHEFREETEEPEPEAAAAAAGGARPPGSGAAANAPARGAPPADDDAALRRRFDWLELVADVRPWYGFIENAEKFTLNERPGEAVKFQRRDPRSGRLLGSGSIERDRIKAGGIHFADTAANRTELLLRANPPSGWSATRLPALLDVIEQVLPLGEEDAVAWRRAAEHLAQYVALDPKHARTYELLADVRASLLDFEGELAALQTAQAAGVESAGLVARRARWLGRVGARAGALARFAAGVSRFPNDRELRLAWGRALLAQGSPDAGALALAQFEQAEQRSQSAQERMEVIAAAGAAYLEQGDAERALQEARRILNVDRNSPLGCRLEGAAAYALGRYTDAVTHWERLRELAQTPAAHGEAALSLGIARTRLGEFETARSDLELAPRLDPRLGARAAAAEADLLAVTGSLDTAVARCRDAVAGAPDDPHLRYFLGRMLRRAGDLQAAQVELRGALALGATFSDLFTELGYLALLEGRADAARRYFEESLRQEEHEETLLLLAHAHLLAEDLVAARKLLDGLNARKPTGESLLGIAYCLYRRGESPSAQELWHQVANELQSAHPDDKAYAGRWLTAVLDLESKQIWEDAIQWREIGNGWEVDERFGLKPTVQTGAFRLAGVQRQGTTIEQWSYLRRDVELASFFEFEVDVSSGPDHQGRVGFGLAHFIGAASQQAPQVRVSLLLAIDSDGSLSVQQRERVDDVEWRKIGTIAFQPGAITRLALRRRERASPVFQFLVNGSPVGPPIEMTPWRGKTRQQISALFFAAAAGGKRCDASLHHARRVEFLAAP